MGYHTDFSGKFDVTPMLKPEHREYLKRFNETRRMERSVNEAAKLPDPVREAAGLPLGDYAKYFVGGSGFHGQGNDPSVQDHSRPPMEAKGAADVARFEEMDGSSDASSAPAQVAVNGDRFDM